MRNNLFQTGRAFGPLPPFQARFPWYGGDLQTLRNTIHFIPPDLAPYPAHRLTLPMSDGSGDAILAHVNMPRGKVTKPTVVLIHGLTGGETSRNILASTAYHVGRGHPVVRINLRNAGPSLGLCKHLYNAGRSQDLRDALAGLPADLKALGLFLVGVSLGGNLLLKCLAERDGLSSVIGGASVCAPIDLKAAQQRIMAPRNIIYHKHLLQCLIRDARYVFKDAAVLADLETIQTIYDFDDRIVAPFGGFTGADDYYRRSSAAPVLSAIEVPTLLLTAANDPWIPVDAYLTPPWTADGPLSIVVTAGGGHVGFHGKDSPIPWHNRAIGAFIDSLR